MVRRGVESLVRPVTSFRLRFVVEILSRVELLPFLNQGKMITLNLIAFLDLLV